MDPFRLRVPPPLVEAMIAHARAELPNECVGFLAGTITDGIATASQCLPLVNELASPTAFYAEPFVAFRAMRAAGTDLLAIYHSHPTSAPVPSTKDLERNYYGPGYPWIIVGLAGAEPEVRAWWLGESDFRETNFS